MNYKTYSIGDAAKLSGASQKQIRNWEAKGHIPVVDRVVSGDRAYRRFSPDEVEVLRSIKGFLDEGFTLPASAKKAIAKHSASKGVTRYV